MQDRFDQDPLLQQQQQQQPLPQATATANKISREDGELANAKEIIQHLRERCEQQDQQLQKLQRQLQLQRQQSQAQQVASPTTFLTTTTCESDADADGSGCNDHATAATGSTSTASAATNTTSSSTTTTEDRPQKRRRYTDSDKYHIFRTYQSFGRKAALSAAAEIGMPKPTARSILLRFDREGKEAIHDKRLDKGGPGPNSKREEWHGEMLCEWLHWDATITLKALVAMLNAEIGRRILCRELDKECPTCGPLLSESERKSGYHVDIEERMESACEKAKEEYEKGHIRCERTIRDWLRQEPYLYTRKVVVKQKTSANTDENMRKRLVYAQEVQKMLTSSSYYPIFIDEMPFYSTMSSTKGRSPKGQRAVVLVPPESNLTHRNQVAMAVHQEFGLIYGDSFPPVKGARNWTAQYGKKEFREFLQGLFHTLMVKKDPRSKIEYAETFRNKRIRIIWDNASDHGSRREAAASDNGIPDDVKPENFDEFVSFARERGSTVRIVYAAPISPHLNLCEFYNRVLRSLANTERNRSEVRKALLEVPSRGHVISNRMSVLDNIIQESLETLKYERGALSGAVATMSSIAQKVIDKNGFLDWHWVN